MHRRCFLKCLAFAPAAALAQERTGMPPVEHFTPGDEPNSPIGEAIGIRPGRVAWVRDGAATSWDGITGQWWDDASTDQRSVDRMTTRVLLDLTGQKNEKQAWDALFRNFNETHKFANAGYRPGERIAIKINANQDRGPDWSNLGASFGRPSGSRGGGRSGGAARMPQNGVASPHAVASLVSHLIQVAGVRGADIMLYDTTGGRNIGQPIYSRIRANADPQFQAVQFLVGTDYELGGRLSARQTRRTRSGFPKRACTRPAWPNR